MVNLCAWLRKGHCLLVYSFRVMSTACLFPHICVQHAGPRRTAPFALERNASFDSVIQITQPSSFIGVENV